MSVTMGGLPAGAVDFAALPGKLDAAFLKLDGGTALRSTIIKPGTTWFKRFQKSLLTPMDSKMMHEDDCKQAKNQAFDLMDALSKSGVLAFERCELHVVLAATHCFDKNLIETVIQDNVNPISRVERSTLLMCATVRDVPAAQLVAPSHNIDLTDECFQQALEAPK